MKSVSKYKEVAQYWAKHNRSIVRKAKQATGFTDLGKETVKHQFVDNVEAYMEEDGMSASDAIAKTLRGREFKSQADFYAESVMENLKDNELYRTFDWTYLKDRFGIKTFAKLLLGEKRWNDMLFYLHKKGI